ncbi:aldo/keto reductase [Streptomyces lasalocidi]|uniref:Aldo/keto reductase n=1 Tax=Streptomyces lasalocidi TaxID=324833 RepID=A0A4V6AUH9_STRLS|nr:aldo/keto reductase [Streptomyces lasalocidi]TKS96082.1 aldo/keto reductase [Streptomyces lasalocidi]
MAAAGIAISPPRRGESDCLAKVAWFTPEALRIISDGLRPLRERFGDSPAALTRVALQVCLQRAENAAVLVGFTSPEQVKANLTAVGTPLTDDELAFVRDTLSRLQQNLDAHSEVFLDEKDAGR